MEDNSHQEMHELSTEKMNALREADPYTESDTEMSRWIDKLTDETAHHTRRANLDAALRAQLKSSSLPELPVTPTNFPDNELNDTSDDADSESEDHFKNSVIAFPNLRACSLIPTMPKWSPRKSSTPKSKKPRVRFKSLDAISEHESDNDNPKSLKPIKSPIFQRVPLPPVAPNTPLIFPLPPFPPLNKRISSSSSASDPSDPQPIRSMIKNNVLSTHRCLTYKKR